MVQSKQIEELVHQIAVAFLPQRIVLFGSHASGTADDESDVDLLIITDFMSRRWEYSSRIRARVRPTFALDLLVRSPAELKQRLEMGDPFISEIIDRGRVLYEAADR